MDRPEQLTSHSACLSNSEGKSCHGNRLRKWGQLQNGKIEYRHMYESFVSFVHRITSYFKDVEF